MLYVCIVLFQQNMLNTGLRRGEACGIINSDIDLERRVLHIRRAVKEVNHRDGMEIGKG